MIRRVKNFQYFCLLPSALVEFLLPSLDSSYGLWCLSSLPHTFFMCRKNRVCDSFLLSCGGRLGFVTLSCFHVQVG
jgi:hypothetical protein